MKLKEMNKINLRIQEFKDNFRPASEPTTRPIDKRKRNQAKRLARKLRGK
jgi:hypothetical protein